MIETVLSRVAPDDMEPGARAAYDALQELTGDATFVQVFAKAPELLDFAMVEFYQKLFFEGRVPEKYMQLARLRLSMSHGCRTCNNQNVPSVIAQGYSEDQVQAMETMEAESTNKSGETKIYTGVTVNALLEQAGLQSEATTLTFVADDGYTAEVALSEVLACQDCIVSFRNQGGFSTVLPGFSGNVQVKGVTEIQVQ